MNRERPVAAGPPRPYLPHGQGVRRMGVRFGRAEAPTPALWWEVAS